MNDPQRIVMTVKDCRIGASTTSDDDVTGSFLNGHVVQRAPGETLTALLKRTERMHGRPQAVHVHLLQYSWAPSAIPVVGRL